MYIPSTAFHGQLFIGDCYIALKTYWNESSELDWDIYFWIGNEASVSTISSKALGKFLHEYTQYSMLLV